MKYAIYKQPTGLYAMEYYDTYDPDVFKRNGIFAYENLKDMLPVVVNRVGGRHEFWSDDPKFVELKECGEGEDPLTLDEMYSHELDKFKYGWISPDGILYACEYRDHRRCADDICYFLYGKDYRSSEDVLETHGWIRVVKVRNDDMRPTGTGLFSKDFIMSKEQARVLYKLGYSGHPDYQFMMEYNKDSW